MKRWLLISMVLWMSAMALAQSANSSPPATPRQQLKQIRSQPLFQRWELRRHLAKSENKNKKAITSYLQKLIDKLNKWIDKQKIEKESQPNETTSSSHGGIGIGIGIGIGSMLTVFLWIAVVLLGGFLIYVMVQIFWIDRQQATDGAVLSRKQVREALESGEALALPAQQWLSEAMRFAEDNESRVAFRALYLALLSGLHAHHKIDFRQNRTNWVYVNHYRGSDQEKQIFTRLTSMFDDVWYGLHCIETQSLHAVQHQVGQLLQEGDGNV